METSNNNKTFLFDLVWSKELVRIPPWDHGDQCVWHCTLSCYLTPHFWPNSLLICLGRQGKSHPLGPQHTCGSCRWSSGSWLWFRSFPAYCGIWVVNQWVGDASIPPLPAHYYSAFQINASLRTKGFPSWKRLTRVHILRLSDMAGYWCTPVRMCPCVMQRIPPCLCGRPGL